MSTICVVAPPQWTPLVDALVAAGHECVALLGDKASYNAIGIIQRVAQETAAFEAALNVAGPPALIDLQKTGRAVGAVDVLVHQIGVLGMNLSTAYGVRRFAEEAVRECKASAVVVICTYDVPGRAAIAGAQAAGVPVIHLQHALATDPPEQCWYAAEEPGDVVFVPGERDRDWWRRCARDAKVLVTGNPLWDCYHTAPKRQHPGETVILWGDQSPTNQEQQTPDYWHSRHVPEAAWQAFLEYLKQPNDIGGVVFKARGEEALGYTEGRWDALRAVCERRGLECWYYDGAPVESFERASLVVCQDSNLGVEALHLGIPVVSITRPGSRLFDYGGALEISGTSAHLPRLLGEAITEGLAWWKGRSLVKEAVTYNKGAEDGQSMARVVEAIETVARDGIPAL